MFILKILHHVFLAYEGGLQEDVIGLPSIFVDEIGKRWIIKIKIKNI